MKTKSFSGGWSELPSRWLDYCALLMLSLSGPLEVVHAQRTSFGDFGLPTLPGAKQVELEATYELQQDSQVGRLKVVATIIDGWHMYSVTQPAGGPLETKIKSSSDFIEFSGPFAPDHAPDVKFEEFWPGVPIEEHHGTVTWTAPLKLTKDIDPATSPLKLQLNGQVCKPDGSCIPISEKFDAKFTGYYGAKAKVEKLRVEGTHAEWSASLEPATVAPGGSAVIKLRAQTDKGYHVYEFVPNDPETKFRTVIVATAKAGLRFGAPTTAAETEAVDAGGDKPAIYHKGPVEWTIPISVPETAGSGEHPIALQVAFMTCNDSSCDIPSGVEFSGSLQVSAEAQEANGAAGAALSVASVDFKEVASQPNLASWIDNNTAPAAELTLSQRAAGNGLELWMVFAAIAGGFILNFMPCVLPVIGLKLMSFVNQAGSSHARVVTLNLTYVAGILAVMIVLAAVNISFKLAGDAFGWGQQFQDIRFQVPMAVLVFAMALSFLGVWEIPIPGFATSSKSGELLEKEGLSGAFFKGILTTVLATPCSGPFLGTLFGLTLTLSVGSILLLYMLVGIGLGVPYLALCVSPGFIKLMPKPGAWMETLKQILAFPLLMTVVFFITMINPDYRIATLILLIVVWFACWLIGRVPPYAEARRIRAAWATGIVTSVLGAVIGFAYFGPTKHELPWVPYNEAALAQYRSEGKTVMIEFTARWCLVCQTNMKFAIDRPEVAQLVNQNQVVPLLADWSDRGEEIFNKIKELDSLSIPLLAIYPADPNAEPIILRDLITESQLLEALKQAGPSGSKVKLTSAPN